MSPTDKLLYIFTHKYTEVKFDYNSQKDGNLKTTDVEYNKKMKAATSTNPEEYAVKLAQGLVEKENPENVDGVTGASRSSKDFVVLANAAIVNVKQSRQDRRSKSRIIPHCTSSPGVDMTTSAMRKN
ncbi:MAG: hypothetical protein ACR5LD_07040 [Symbiopectobacterium sp.]